MTTHLPEHALDQVTDIQVFLVCENLTRAIALGTRLKCVQSVGIGTGVSQSLLFK